MPSSRGRGPGDEDSSRICLEKINAMIAKLR